MDDSPEVSTLATGWSMDLVMDSSGCPGMSLNGALCHSWDRFLNTSNHVLVVVWRRVADFVVKCPSISEEGLRNRGLRGSNPLGRA